LTAAGVLEPVDAIKLVRQRGLFMEEAVVDIPGSMAAVLGLTPDDLKDVCCEASSEGLVEVANYNCPGQIVISGATAAVEKAIELAKTRGAKRSVMLQVSGPFHTSLMQPVGSRIREEIRRYNLSHPKIPIVMNYTADYATAPDEISELMIKQISGSVRWEETLRRMVSDGVTTFVEVGPGRVLSAFVKRTVNNSDIKVLSVEDPDDVKNVASIVG
jgi:[acyl-carrier-protein] S-malonyltransferase